MEEKLMEIRQNQTKGHVQRDERKILKSASTGKYSYKEILGTTRLKMCKETI